MAATTDLTVRLHDRLPRAFAALLFVYYAAVILLHRVPPMLGDMSNWAYAGMLLGRHLHGLPDTFHVLKHYPVPNSTLTVVLGLLCAVLPWNVAFKVFLIAYLTVCFGTVCVLARDERLTSHLVYRWHLPQPRRYAHKSAVIPARRRLNWRPC